MKGFLIFILILMVKSNIIIDNEYKRIIAHLDPKYTTHESITVDTDPLCPDWALKEVNTECNLSGKYKCILVFKSDKLEQRNKEFDLAQKQHRKEELETRAFLDWCQTGKTRQDDWINDNIHWYHTFFKTPDIPDVTTFMDTNIEYINRFKSLDDMDIYYLKLNFYQPSYYGGSYVDPSTIKTTIKISKL